MIYRYKCQSDSCGAVEEKTIPIKEFDSEKLSKCPRCSSSSKHIFEGAPAVATSGMYQASLDVIIGRDAAKRWDNIRRRQVLRDKVREESGKVGITATGRDGFATITENKKQLRTDVMKAAEKFSSH